MVNSTQLIEMSQADYEMLKETGREGEKVMHYNGYLDGFGAGVREGKKSIIAEACVWLKVYDITFTETPSMLEDFRRAMEELK